MLGRLAVVSRSRSSSSPALPNDRSREVNVELGMGEIVVILVVALLFFGPSKLPKLGDALGRGIRNFKRASEGLDEPAPAPASPEARSLPSAPASSAAPANVATADAQKPRYAQS